MDIGVRHCAVLITDIANSMTLRTELGDAVAGPRIRGLLDGIMAAVRSFGGEVIKSYGDDVLAVFERDPISSAAETAIVCQRLADRAGLPIYAGIHAGPVEFRITMGHPDAVGQTVNIAARLHKLREGAPGEIFLTQASVDALAESLRPRAFRFGLRDVKGVGAVSIWTLQWRDLTTTAQTVYQTLSTDIPYKPSANPVLVLRHQGRAVKLIAGHVAVIGRGAHCALQIQDAIPRVSTSHLQLDLQAGRWFAQDISRNGTWLRDSRSAEESLLPHFMRTLLPRSGAFCLGRPFREDPDEMFSLTFEFENG